ncbi:NAD(P)H-binding protein [Devosia sp. BSSL-BM10]|uniref:NAD(P)H-binding protein n=1 Tax=Devosia litorisediminis TaxID=2829817 RepID=A0A942E6F9_9HYPH|nr:NAD-dependent epimerase/dehydratase family protein [Devosia litorisediminis]MBS3848381.1 NAD(P)H-binding protein [Devosia litorisediminis]
MSSIPILVIGATGKIGSRVAARLTQAGYPVRPASRRSTPAFDWDDRTTWAATLAGAETAFVSYVPDLAEDGAPQAIQAFTDLAVAAGLKRLVLLSGRGETNALRSEDILMAAPIETTIVRASWFFQNFSEGTLLPSVLSGTIAMPAGDRREPFIDADDVADVAVAALTDPRHANQRYEITGPRLLTFAEAAAVIAATAGIELQYLPITLEQFHAALLPELGQRYADLLTRLCQEVFDGRNEALADGVQRALGRPPRDFADYVTATAASGVWHRAA